MGLDILKIQVPFYRVIPVKTSDCIPDLPILAPVSLPGISEIPVKPPDSDPEKNTLNIRPDCRNASGNAITRWLPKHL